jgi:hypothetical protein
MGLFKFGQAVNLQELIDRGLLHSKWTGEAGQVFPPPPIPLSRNLISLTEGG